MAAPRRAGPCMVLRVADSCYVNLGDLGSSRHKSECCEVAVVIGGRPSEKRYAMKVYHQDTVETRRAFQNELRALRLSRTSPFVVSLHRACQQQLVLIQELAAFDLSKISSRLPLSWVRWVAAALIQALDHAHSHRAIHLDIKPDNVLVSFYGTPKLCDFGCALHLDECDDRVALSAFRGTMVYAAPEMLDERKDGTWQHVASRASDLWSLGMLCYRLTFARLPKSYENLEAASCSDDDDTLQCMRAIAKAAREPLVLPSENASSDMQAAWDFMSALLRQDPAQRDARAAKPHTWRSSLYDELRLQSFFKGLDWKALAAKQLSPLDLVPPLCATELNRELTV